MDWLKNYRGPLKAFLVAVLIAIIANLVTMWLLGLVG